MRKCKRCGVVSSLNNFYKHIRSKEGHEATCIDCKKKNYHKKYNKFKKKYGISIQSVKMYGFELATIVYSRAKFKCEKCGEVNDLTIHHKDNKGINLKKRGLPMNNKPINLQVLCRSCHGRLHWLQSIKVRKNIWSKKDLDIIEKNLKVGEMKELLPHKTLSAIYHQRSRINGKIIYPPK